MPCRCVSSRCGDNRSGCRKNGLSCGPGCHPGISACHNGGGGGDFGGFFGGGLSAFSTRSTVSSLSPFSFSKPTFSQGKGCSCNTSDCSNNLCGCRKSGVLCSTGCHPGKLGCSNKPSASGRRPDVDKDMSGEAMVAKLMLPRSSGMFSKVSQGCRCDKSECSSNSCGCRKSGVLCSAGCHPEKPGCSNKSSASGRRPDGDKDMSGEPMLAKLMLGNPRPPEQLSKQGGLRRITEDRFEPLHPETTMNSIRELRQGLEAVTEIVTSATEASQAEFNSFVETVTRRFENCMAEVRYMKDQLDLLQTNQEEIWRQYLSEKPQEDLYQIIVKIGKALDVALTKENIDTAYRAHLGEDEEKGESLVVVRLVNKWKKQVLLEKAEQRDLSTLDIGIQGTGSGSTVIHIT